MKSIKEAESRPLSTEGPQAAGGGACISHCFGNQDADERLQHANWLSSPSIDARRSEVGAVDEAPSEDHQSFKLELKTTDGLAFETTL